MVTPCFDSLPPVAPWARSVKLGPEGRRGPSGGPAGPGAAVKVRRSTWRTPARLPAPPSSAPRLRLGHPRGGSRWLAPRTRPALGSRGYLRPGAAPFPTDRGADPQRYAAGVGVRPALAHGGPSSAPRPAERGTQAGAAARGERLGIVAPGRGGRGRGACADRGVAAQGEGRRRSGAAVARGEGGAAALAVLAGRGWRVSVWARVPLRSPAV